MTSEPWTVGRLLNWTTAYFRDRGGDSPRLDAEVLLAEALGCRRIELYTTFGELVDEPRRAAFRGLVRRRAEGTPVAYLVGQKEFYSLAFRVTPDVLIPRPETEQLIVILLDLARESGLAEQSTEIADVGTGSGILAVCAAKFLPKAHITAIDISKSALAVARENAASHGVDDRVEFLEGDLLAPAGERQLNFVLSNPPYVSEDEFARLEPEVKDHEPRSALLAGPSGSEVIARLIPQAAERLVAGGWLIVEISPMIALDVRRLLESDGRYEQVDVLKDFAGRERMVKARRGGSQRSAGT